MEKIILLTLILLLFIIGCNNIQKEENKHEEVNPAITQNPITKKIAYIPIDDCPVNVARVIYLISSLGYEALIPESDLYKTRLDNQGLNSNNTQYGDCDKLL